MANSSKEVHYSPNDPANCVPTSGVVCVYCKNQMNCPNKLDRTELNRPDDYTSTDFDSKPLHVHDFTS